MDTMEEERHAPFARFATLKLHYWEHATDQHHMIPRRVPAMQDTSVQGLVAHCVSFQLETWLD